MGISCTKLRFFGKKRVFLVHCDVCCSLCNVVDIVEKEGSKFCTLCNIEYESGRLRASDVFI